MPKSTLKRALVYGGQASLMAIDSTEAVREAIRRHGLAAGSAAALARVMTFGVYLAAWLKEGEVSVTLAGDGLGGKICVTLDAALRVSGKIENPHCTENYKNVIGQKGYLTVVRDGGEGLPCSGTVAFSSGEPEEAFSAYFSESEQRTAEIALSVLFGADGLQFAGGVFLQPLPAAEAWVYAQAKQDLADCRSLFGDGFSENVFRKFGAENAEAREFGFFCRCSRERAESAVLSLGRAGAEELLARNGKISVRCDMCNTEYIIDRARISALFGDKA